jgi:hypothetical protein
MYLLEVLEVTHMAAVAVHLELETVEVRVDTMELQEVLQVLVAVADTVALQVQAQVA